MTTSHRVGKVIRAAREKLQLSEHFCAVHSGLSIEAYGDVESHEAEFFDNISLGTARRICWLVQLDLIDLVTQFFATTMRVSSTTSDADFFGRHSLVLATRLKKGLSESALATAIGFSDIVVEMLERTPDFIESLPIGVVIAIAHVLSLDPSLLICRRLPPAHGLR
jgi:transcriptional regulator with XRE-family HTH domain